MENSINQRWEVSEFDCTAIVIVGTQKVVASSWEEEDAPLIARAPQLLAENEELRKQNAEMRKLLQEVIQADDEATEAEVTDTEAYELLDGPFYKIRSYLFNNRTPNQDA